MDHFTISSETHGHILLFIITGYFGEDAGNDLKGAIDEKLSAGIHDFILDFGACDVINSLGLSGLFELTLKVCEDFQGRVVLTAMSGLMAEVVELSGIGSFAEITPDRSAALRFLADS